MGREAKRVPRSGEEKGEGDECEKGLLDARLRLTINQLKDYSTEKVVFATTLPSPGSVCLRLPEIICFLLLSFLQGIMHTHVSHPPIRHDHVQISLWPSFL